MPTLLHLTLFLTFPSELVKAAFFKAELELKRRRVEVEKIAENIKDGTNLVGV